MSKWFRINEITDWEEDTQMMDGDASHEGWRAVQRLLEEEREKKIDNSEWNGLPFVCEAETEEEAIDKYNDEVCDGEYIKALAADCEEVHKFTVSLQVDCRVDVEVFATDFEEVKDNASYTSFDKNDLDIIEIHAVNGTDEVTGEFRDLC